MKKTDRQRLNRLKELITDAVEEAIDLAHREGIADHEAIAKIRTGIANGIYGIHDDTSEQTTKLLKLIFRPYI